MTNATPSRAQVGIGTLVVFVSMVLVASVAAGVLINTAGLLQSQSEATGESSSSQVADRLLVVGQTGTAIQDDSIGLVNLTVTRGAGAGDIDLRNTTISWVGPDGAHNLVADRASGASGDGEFHVTSLSDSNDSEPVLDGSDDQLVLTFDLGTDDFDGLDEFGERLGPGDQVSLTLATESGASTTARLAVPRSISGEEAVVL